MTREEILKEEERLYRIVLDRAQKEYETDPCERGYVDFQRERLKKNGHRN